MAYTRLGWLVANANPILPYSPSGKPSSLPNFFQFLPPSMVRYRPLPGPPLLKSHGVRRCCHMLASRRLGLEGSITRSLQPEVSLVYRIFVHVSPPSVVLKTPLSGCMP